MADGISFKVVTGPFHAAIVDRQRRMERAAMFTVRGAGRACAAAAKAAAPVLRAGESGATSQRAWRSGGGTVGGAPVAGLLRSSIKPSRRLKKVGDDWSLTVGPRGLRVHLYAGKEEEREAYMQAGFEAAIAELPAIAEAAFARAWAR